MRFHRTALLAAALILAASVAHAQSDQELTLEHQGLTRHYLLHLPPGAPGAGPRPLVIALHGLEPDADWHRPVADFRAWWTMDAVADREGFAVVYPAAIDGKWSYAAERPVTVPGRTELLDDLGFLNAMIDTLIASNVADPARIFATGASRGGLLAWTMACTMPDRIAAVAPLITGMIDGQIADCHPAHLMPILALAGTADGSQPYEGWLYHDGNPAYRLASIPETMEFWRHLHDCTGETWQGLPHRDGVGPTRVALLTWTGCSTGGPVQLLRVQGGGHQLPSLTLVTEPRKARNQDIETAEEIWQFFARGALEHPAPR